ncbi:MAG: glycosyltransferase family 4 protein [Verrucomicrobiae bacterium]|nr:glycosyltransferase family 4 protein [Verrucomicrobiae bacterium]
MRILFLTQGNRSTPSSRGRALQYLPALEAAGHECVVRPAVREGEAVDGEDRGGFGARGHQAFRTFTRRVQDLHQIRDYDWVHVQRPILPPPLFDLESRIARETRMIFDLDAPLYLGRGKVKFPSLAWLRARRLSGICRRAKRVVVENEELAAFVRRQGVEPVLLPSAVDTESYFAKGAQERRMLKIPVLGWFAAGATDADLRELLPSLFDLHSRAPFVFRVIGGTPHAISARCPIEWTPRSAEGEASDFAELDIGLLPRKDTPWNRAQPALRLVQFWAAGVPVVASPVGVAMRLIRHGENGLLASGRAEWSAQILRLIRDRELRRRLIAEGRRLALEQHSVQALAPRFLALFEETKSEGAHGGNAEDVRAASA